MSGIGRHLPGVRSRKGSSGALLVAVRVTDRQPGGPPTWWCPAPEVPARADLPGAAALLLRLPGNPAGHLDRR